jgi:hypothetical protein
MKRNFLYCAIAVWLLTGSTLLASEFRFPVRHDHAISSCRGELIFSEAGVEYQTTHKKHARIWKYEDIQQLGLLGPKEISILTYEDQKWKLGKDRDFRFEVIKGGIDASLWTTLQGKVTRPLVSAVIPKEAAPLYQIPVKHERRLSGTEGVLEISGQYIVYRTKAERDSRIWRYQDISSIGTTGPYQLRLTSMDRVEGEYGGERNFVFTLKRKLEPEIYDYVWWKINGPKISSQNTAR